MSSKNFFNEMKRGFILHAVAAHFSNGLIPVMVLYLMLALALDNTFFEHTVEHLIVIVLMAIPVSYFSGIHDWQEKFRGAKAPIFIKKKRLSLALFVFCVMAVAIRFGAPEVMHQQGVLHWVYLVSLFAMLPLVALLGHYGGKLALQARQAPRPPAENTPKI